MFPYHVARGLGDKTVEELDVTSYKVKPDVQGGQVQGRS